MQISNAATNNMSGEIEKKNDINPERAITPEQSPSTKAQLRQVCILLHISVIYKCFKIYLL